VPRSDSPQRAQRDAEHPGKLRNLCTDSSAVRSGSESVSESDGEVLRTPRERIDTDADTDPRREGSSNSRVQNFLRERLAGSRTYPEPGVAVGAGVPKTQEPFEQVPAIVPIRQTRLSALGWLTQAPVLSR